MARLKFSHRSTTYVFLGEELAPPKPGTYNPKGFEPLTHHLYSVEIQGDGLWVLHHNRAKVLSGDNGTVSTSCAENIVRRYVAGVLR